MGPVFRSYLEVEGPIVARSAFDRRFDEPLERFMSSPGPPSMPCLSMTSAPSMAGPLMPVCGWGGRKQPLHLRFVGSHTPTGFGSFLTNLPPRLGPRQMADRSRGRWEVKLSIRSTAQDLTCRGVKAKRCWQQIAELVGHAGRDCQQ